MIKFEPCEIRTFAFFFLNFPFDDLVLLFNEWICKSGLFTIVPMLYVLVREASIYQGATIENISHKLNG